MIDQDSLHAAAALFAQTPFGSRAMRRHQQSSYIGFVQMLHEDIDEIIQRMERNRAFHRNQSEDQLTYHIAAQLVQLGYVARNGAQVSGSVDLTVEKVMTNWLWTSEAKIFTAIDKVREGFLQLTTRYSPGDVNDAHCGMLIYNMVGKAAAKMKSWRELLESDPEISSKTSPSNVRQDLTFFSNHTDPNSGLEVKVRHMVVALHFDPKDVSGRTSKKYAA